MRQRSLILIRYELQRALFVIENILSEALLQEKKSIADNIQSQARYAKSLFIWTDCDREGEHIGTEIREVAWKGNRRLEVRRAKFSNVERA